MPYIRRKRKGSAWKLAGLQCLMLIAAMMILAALSYLASTRTITGTDLKSLTASAQEYDR